MRRGIRDLDSPNVPFAAAISWPSVTGHGR